MEKFISFLGNLRTEENSSVLETIEHGYMACMEGLRKIQYGTEITEFALSTTRTDYIVIFWIDGDFSKIEEPCPLPLYVRFEIDHLDAGLVAFT